MPRHRLRLIACIIPLAAACARAHPTLAPTLEQRMTLVLPAPRTVAPDRGKAFAVRPDSVITIDREDEDLRRIAGVLADLIGATPVDMPRVVVGTDALAPGSLNLSLGGDPALGDEGYDLTIGVNGVRLAASRPPGLFYGVQTIRQLLPVVVEYEAARRTSAPLLLPAGRIVDTPRFAWRGAMLDVARHFFTPDEVRRYIDLLAIHKINRLHLHLADDQGWRVEIRSRPNLTIHGSRTEVGGGPGGFYTQEEYRAIVRYAAERFITIVPEIDMPGHTNAALASYPELTCDGVAPALYTGIEVGFSALCVGREETYRFIDDVVREIASMTPGPYFHVGGDEVQTLTDEEYRGFIERVQDIVRAHGKRLVGWEEVAAARLHPTSVVQHWRPEVPPELLARAPALILSPGDRAYLDMKYEESTLLGLTWAGLTDLRRAYDWEPAELFPAVPVERLLGVEAPLWSETLANIRDVEFMAFPRLAAIAEVGWSAADRRSWDAFRDRVRALSARYVALGVNFRRASERD